MTREKRRQELYVTVPSVFRCPISMDVMKSPVSLCTGVTYDRSSIEKWLALGHNTCPATMQTLPSTNTTPNLTLRRLIQLWLSQSGLTTPPPLPLPAISKQQAAELINGELDCDSLAKMIYFMKASEENLRFVVESNDAVSRFVDVLSKSGEIGICEMIVEALDLISMEIGVREKLRDLVLNGRDCLASFALVLRKGKMESKVKSAKILELIEENPESQRRISEKQGLIQELYNLISTEYNNPSVVEAGISALLSISTSRPAKKELIRFGIVRTVGRLLCGSEYCSPVRTMTEKALGLLELIATCTEGRGAIGEDTECVVGIVKSLMKCSGAATEHGITVLWSVCCLARDRTAQEEVVKVNGLTKVLLVMQSNCSSSTRHMCGELVKVLRTKITKSNLAPYETRTTHITPY